MVDGIKGQHLAKSSDKRQSFRLPLSGNGGQLLLNAMKSAVRVPVALPPMLDEGCGRQSRVARKSLDTRLAERKRGDKPL